MSPEPVLIAAVSGRALAQSAVRGGYAPIVLDLFDDQDLPAHASRRVCAKDGLRFSPRRLLSAAKQLADGLPLVYGAGFEGCPQTLRQLAHGRTVYGNSTDTLVKVNDPRRFFALLDTLRIPHPEVSLSRPPDAAGWLAKKIGAAGGWHIRPAQSSPDGYYFQRKVSGRSLSVLFLADGKNARIAGFNETWTSASYCYAGAINHARVSAKVRNSISSWLEGLVPALHLCGLNGMDFMLEGEQVNVIEINARPTATLDLYDADFAKGLFEAHIAACRGALPRDVEPKTIRASAVVYADSPLAIGADRRWPGYAADIPRAGAFVPRGAPVCTVNAEGLDFSSVKQEVFARKNSISDMLHQKAA